MFTKSLSRIALVSGLILGASTIVPRIALAEGENIGTGDIYVNNPVMQTLTWTSTATSGATIPLTNNTALTSTSVGTVNVKSNSVDGFTVTVSSTNGSASAGGLLKRVSGTETMLYTINYNGVDIELANGTVEAENPTALDTTCASSTGCPRDVKIAIGQDEINSKPAGAYSDTLTFTLTNK